MGAREEILSKYGEQAQLKMEQGEVYTPAEFMMKSSKGSNTVIVHRKVYDTETGEYLGTKPIKYETSYANYKSAARAFNKLEASKSSRAGERFLKRGEKYYGKDFRQYEPQPGREENLWKVILWLTYDEQREGGTIVHHEAEEKSFIVVSRNHGNNLDAGYIEAATADAADEFVEDWAADEGGSLGTVVGEVIIVDRMAIRIQSTSILDSSPHKVFVS